MSRKAGWIGTLSMVFLLGIVFSTQAAPVPGVTDTEVVIGMTTPVGPRRLMGHHRPRRQGLGRLRQRQRGRSRTQNQGHLKG